MSSSAFSGRRQERDSERGSENMRGRRAIADLSLKIVRVERHAGPQANAASELKPVLAPRRRREVEKHLVIAEEVPFGAAAERDVRQQAVPISNWRSSKADEPLESISVRYGET